MNDIQTLIERSIYEAIRLVLVATGYTPDISLFPETPEGTEDYFNYLDQIQEEKGFAIELFGFSPPESKGVSKLPQIVLVSESFIPGDVGMEDSPIYIPEDEDHFSKVLVDPLAYNLMYSCYLYAPSTESFRVLRNTLHLALKPFQYIPIIGTSEVVLSVATGASSKTNYREGGLDTTYSYYVPDVLFSSTLIEQAASAIKSIHLNTYIQSHLGISTIIKND
jgi:hypothetical protein